MKREKYLILRNPLDNTYMIRDIRKGVYIITGINDLNLARDMVRGL